MNEERLRRLHRLRKASTEERALAVARDEARLRAAQGDEAESIRRRERLRAELQAVATAQGPVSAEVLADRHRGAEIGVRSVVRFTRRVAENRRLLQVSREAARAARAEEERLHVLLVEAVERRLHEAATVEEKERDEIATMRRRHTVMGFGFEEGDAQ